MSRFRSLFWLCTALAAGCGPAPLSDDDAGALPFDGGGLDAPLDGPDGATLDGASARCAVARCIDGVATTCDGAVRLDCTAFGGSCVDAVTADGDVAGWCSCGPLAEGGARCGDVPVECVGGLAYPVSCPGGTVCDDSAGLACYCDDRADGVCPDAACVDDPDCGACTPDCAGRACGDNGCGGDCGSCGISGRCEAGTCVSTCAPSCAGRECGSDGCGGSCGDCPGSTACDTTLARCVEACIPSCDGRRQCEPDGCGGDCGPACAEGLACVATGLLTSECACPTTSSRDVAIEGTTVNWGAVVAVALEVRPTVRRAFERSATLNLTATRTTGSVSIWACDATTEMEVRATYYVRTSSGASPCPAAWETVPFGAIIVPPLTEPVVSCGAP